MPRASPGDVRLGTSHYGEASAPVDVALVHGFTQSRRSFDAVARELVARGIAHVVSVDLPGHGDSPEAPGPDATGWAAEALAATVEPAVLVGYSMGARVCLRRALDDPASLDGLVLVGATAGVGTDDEASARRKADASLAGRIEASSIGAFVDEWLAQPLFAGLSDEAADRGARVANDPARLAAALRGLGVAAGPSMWERLGELGAAGLPVLLVAGARDDKYAALATSMARAIGGGVDVELIEDAGHAAPFEAPQAFVDLLEEFLGRTRR